MVVWPLSAVGDPVRDHADLERPACLFVGGRQLAPAVPYRLRVCSDGARFVCWLDGEPVVARALADYRASAPPLRIEGVGLVANWEWGDDTGTRFSSFEARGRKR